MENTKVTLIRRIGRFFGWGKPVDNATYIAPDSTNGMPIKAGRRTIPNNVGTGFLDNTTIKPDIPFEYLDILQTLASINPDISFAVDNVVQMGSTPYTIDFGDKVSEADAIKMKDVLAESQAKWFGTSTSKVGLVSNMLDRLVINGASVFEMVVENDLSGIQQIILPNPRNIEFKYLAVEEIWQPYQRVKSGSLSSNIIDGALIKLNTSTFKYFPLRTRGEKPYGIPPYLSAIDMTDTEVDVLANFKNVAKNIGVLGFLQILVNRPTRKKSGTGDYMESEQEFNQRCVEYLNTVVRPEAEKGFNTGVMTGFKQDLDMKFESTNSKGIAGADKFMELITHQKHAGLKQNPVFLGRPFNTSEALGRVLLDIFASQISSFQAIIACALAEMFKLELILKGFPVMQVNVTFEAANVKDEVKVQEAQGKKIANLELLYQQGVISQVQRANLLGYDEPAEEKPREPISPIGDAASDNNLEAQNNSIMESLGWFDDIFDYGVCGCTTEHFTGDDGNEGLDRFITGYSGSMGRAYKRFINEVTAKIADRVINMRKGSTKQQVFDAIYNTILRNWTKDFAVNHTTIINRWLDAAYKSFRSDKKVFGGKVLKDKDGKPTKIPAATFDIIDFRTLAYMKKADKLYLGKFITDDDTVKRLRDFIYEEFAKGDIPLGQTEGQKAFIKNMAQTLEIEQYKIERIIKTTTNKMRSYASVNYMQQVGVLEYKVLALIDNKTSDICRKMNGKTFSVPASRARVLKVIKSQSSSVPTVTPFVGSIFKTDELDKLDNISGADLLSKHKIFAPPYHANCRTQIVAVL